MSISTRGRRFKKRFDRKTMDADDAAEMGGAPNNRFSKSLPSENIVFT